jgi:chromosomal replication initiator protein
MVAENLRAKERKQQAVSEAVGSQGIEGAWARVRARLRAEFGDNAYKSWIKPLTLVGVKDGRTVLSAGTRFLRDYVSIHYGDRLAALWREEVGGVYGVELIVNANSTAPVEKPRQRAPQSRTIDDAGEAAGVDGIGAALDPKNTFDAFVTGKPNELAYAAAQRVAESNTAPFNPLFLHGAVGLGKTHLMHAIAWRIRARAPERKVAYVSAERFMYLFIKALRFKETMAFKEQFRSVDVLMIDDIQFISGKDSTQEEFFHTLNALMDENKQVVVSADKSPSELEGIEERLSSRLGWGLVVDIHPTTYELRLSILHAKAECMAVEFPPRVLEFLAHKITSNVRELEGALTRIAAHAELVGREVTIETAQELLQDVLRANDRRITIEEIQKRVCERYNIRMSDMHSARRARAVARPRQVAMYLAKQLTSRSLPEIGRKFGGRDHTTVMHAVKKIDELRAIDSTLDEDVDLLSRMLRG